MPIPSLLDHPSRAVTRAQRIVMAVLLSLAFGLYWLARHLTP